LNASGISNNAKFQTAVICNGNGKLRANTDKGRANGLFDGPSGVFGQAGTLATPTMGTITRNAVGPIPYSYNYNWLRVNEAGITQNWEVRAIRKDALKGEDFAIALGIPNYSIVIVDTDNGIIKKRFKTGPPSTDYVMYYCINNITRADSAGKANENDVHLFSGFNGIICKALISNQPIIVNGNNELKMNYVITNTSVGGTAVRQEWAPIPTDGSIARQIVGNAHNENNISTRSGQIRGSFRGDQNPSEATINTMLADDAHSTTFINATLGKRSGDYFQGWITKYLLKKLTDLFSTKYYTKNGARYEENTEQNISIQALHANSQLGDILTATGDFPYLCYCIECLGVSVLFKDGQDVVYIRKVIP
jgi:hypothetical protein